MPVTGSFPAPVRAGMEMVIFGRETKTSLPTFAAVPLYRVAPVGPHCLVRWRDVSSGASDTSLSWRPFPGAVSALWRTAPQVVVHLELPGGRPAAKLTTVTATSTPLLSLRPWVMQMSPWKG
ncbi:unnamed protein product [Lota lota]